MLQCASVWECLLGSRWAMALPGKAWTEIAHRLSGRVSEVTFSGTDADSRHFGRYGGALSTAHAEHAPLALKTRIEMTRVVASEACERARRLGWARHPPGPRLSTVTEAGFQDVDYRVHVTAEAFAADGSMPSSR